MKKSVLHSISAVVIATALATPATVEAQKISSDKVAAATEFVQSTVPALMGIGPVKVTSINADARTKTLRVALNDSYGDVPFTAADVENLQKGIKEIVGQKYANYDVKLTVGKNAIDKYLMDYSKRYARHNKHFVEVKGTSNHFKHGMSGNVIALWQSHGWYFEPSLNRWEWQRARLNETVEDLYTQSYVIPFLMPMLENAGAYVMSPRERDIHDFEIVVDNDGERAQKSYAESNGRNAWETGEGVGFGWKREYYVDYQNPFAEGTYRQVESTSESHKASRATWTADMPEDGTYAVYVSYETLPESVEDAEYTINYLDGSKTIKVNQKMGGGTWIYLGHYPLKKGENKDVVVLSNVSKHKGVVTADAVKIGGGMGNVARRVKKPEADEKVKYTYDESMDYPDIVSNHPRFTEGSRYWLQWAGCPDSVYTTSRLTNDYTDDYKSRGEWVNWLAGGSNVLPEREGLNIPVDLAFAFHTDAGTTPNDSIVGSLGIYMSDNYGKYADGTPRGYSRLLTNAVLTNICDDVRAQFEPNWMRRGMWDKSYYEARVPEVPTMLLELLSHQNFADMRYGLDPSFRFTVSRAIYKGMLEFLAKRDGRDYVVQPLPVNSFAIAATGNNKFTLTWAATEDAQCENAKAEKYIVMERVGNGAFNEIATVSDTRYEVAVNDNEIHSYKIVAMNAGGKSFDSETLALGVAPKSKGTVMIVNGFTRVSAPDSFEAGAGDSAIAGFNDMMDGGVPYKYDISYIGSQFEFRRNLPWKDDDAAGFGGSHSNYETKVIAGNTFDYPCVHGAAVMAAGYSFVSASVKAVEDGQDLAGYFAVDLIFGKQKEIKVGRGVMPSRYKIYTQGLMEALTKYTAQGGNVMATGSFVASDVWDGIGSGKAEQTFAKNVLGYEWLVGHASTDGKAYMVASPFKQLPYGKEYKFNNTKNDKMYVVESPDGLKPASKEAKTIFRYSENNIPAGVAAKMGAYKTVVLGFPFETIECGSCRHALMTQVLDFFASK